MTDLTRYTLTPVHGLPVPSGGDPNRIPADLGALAEVIDTQGSILRRLDAAQIAALAPAQRPIGVTVHNLTIGCAQVWDGAAWVSYQLAPRYRDYACTVRQGSTDLAVSGSSVARWVQIGSHVHVHCELAPNTSASVVGALAISLPVPPVHASVQLGSGTVSDGYASLTRYCHVARVGAGSPAWAGLFLESGARIGDTAIRPTYIAIEAQYEAA